MEKIVRDRPRGFLVGVKLHRDTGVLDVEDSLAELGLLADTAGIHVVGQTYQRLNRPDSATFIRSGKVEEVHDWVEELEVDIVIFDDELSPRHQHQLEEIFGEDVRIIDRTALILDIFAQHARTREGALQVALAQYEYRLPRLTRQWTHLARQAGGGAARGGAGGVGLRGPGETQLETDRREIGRRIAHIKSELEAVRAHRERHRARRRQSGVSIVALVGYTNAGKSTLLNQLSGASVYVADKLFATLDPTTRRVTLPAGQEVLFTDTVGFIQKLPHLLVAAFRATLEEITEADVLLHVVDASHPNALEQIRAVEVTLVDELGITDTPALVVLNKIDLPTDPEDREVFDKLRADYPEALAVSALRGDGMGELLKRVEQMVRSHLVRLTVRLPYSEGELIARFHELALVENEIHADAHVELVGMLEPRYLAAYQAFRVDTQGEA
jgi:GTP-binding protein HflX